MMNDEKMSQTDEVSDKLQQPGQIRESSDPRSGRTIHLLLTVVGAIGIPAIFLHFSWDVSPFTAAFVKDFDLWQIAWPAFLPILITIASIRWLFITSISKTELSLAWSAGFAATALICFSLLNIIKNNGWPAELREWLSLVIPVLILGLGIFTLIRTRQDRKFRQYRAIMSMQIAYIANCLLCLISLFGGWQIGAYFCLVTVIAYVNQIISVIVYRYDVNNNRSNS